ncbi:Multidrug resistance-like ATP-binding protein MdlA [Buchnera aphidicola (Thelaxes suberi)]|uniref:ABC transporter transmembrane domain-containing protein n=1 Tax=Buchnera aphidicola TaxID=9 RepID=UPI003464886F
MKLFKQLTWYFIKEWKRYSSAISLLIIIALLQLIPPKITGELVDIIVKKEINNNQKIIFYIISLIIIAFIIYILRCIWRILLFGAAYRLSIHLRTKFYTALSYKQPCFYFKNRTGDLMTKATNDIDKVVFAAGEGVLTLVDSFFMGISVLFMMCQQISFQLTLIALAPMPIMAIIITNYGKQLHEKFHEYQKKFSALNNYTQECLTNIRMIRAFGLEKEKFYKFEQIAKEAGLKNLKTANIDSKFDPVIHVAIAFSNLLSIVIGSWFVSNNKISFGQLTTFIMYLGLMIWPMLALAWMFNIVERGSAAWERISPILIHKKNKIRDHYFFFEKIYPILKLKKIEIKINEFTYSIHKKITLKNINFTITKGDIIGICGPTGSGKSTIIQLIQRNFENYKGDILYNSISIKKFSLKEWRSNLSVVNQSTFLFSDTIYKNITLGKPHASYSEVKKVAKIANIHNDIINFENGYNTQVGEKGIMLSGGQKQRISIARALLFNSNILILDNALSAVDAITEYNILNNINKWKTSDKTIIIVSHRMSTLKRVNIIIVMKEGEILQKGTHTNLMKEKNWYQQTYFYQKMELCSKKGIY